MNIAVTQNVMGANGGFMHTVPIVVQMILCILGGFVLGKSTGGGGVKTFRNNNGKGFHITFPNGLTLSTQFGWGNYCDNYNSGLSVKEEMEKHDWESDNAEIAIIDKDGKWLTSKFKDNGDEVLGYVKINDWLEAFDWCRSYEPIQAGSE